MFWVLLLISAWVVAGTACARLCAASVREGTDTTTVRRELTLYEAAFLSGGPVRVAEVTLVAMSRQRRVLLAHTGWATVVDPDGRDDVERSVIGAMGARGQARVDLVRRSAPAAEAVRRVGERLVAAGLAVPEGAPATVAGAVGQVRAAAAGVGALAAVALLMPAQETYDRLLVALWFALPLALTLGCLAIARVEAHPYTRWASPAGRRLLARYAAEDGGGVTLGSVAVRGVGAVGEPDVRAAFGHR
jgi:uncharacterized protein (TIGR04222 family)